MNKTENRQSFKQETACLNKNKKVKFIFDSSGKLQD